MTLKIKIEGPPDEIAAYLARVSKADGIKSTRSTEITKRDESHQWGSCLAWAEVDAAGFKADYSIYQRAERGKKGKRGQAKVGYVYVLPAYDKAGLIGHKIGKTLTPYSRRKSFGNKLYFSIEFIALVRSDDYTALETTLHRHFKTKRQSNSEFFNLLPEDIVYIQAMMSDEDNALLLQVNAALK
jgi:hypothetical protein